MRLAGSPSSSWTRRSRSQKVGVIPLCRFSVLSRFWPKADMTQNAIDVAIEGKADVPFCAANVCLRRQSGHLIVRVRLPA